MLGTNYITCGMKTIAVRDCYAVLHDSCVKKRLTPVEQKKKEQYGQTTPSLHFTLSGL